MWWERWIPESYLIKDTICGVECVFNEHETVFHYTVIQAKKRKIEIIEQGSTEDSTNILAIAKKRSAPIALAVNGKGVIIKKIIFSENASLQLKDLLQQNLPAIPYNEFYIQFYKNITSSGHIALCRKEQTDHIINQFNREKTELVNVFIGPLICNAMSDMTTTYNRLSTSLHQLELENGYIDTVYSRNNMDESVALEIDDLKIPASQTVSFAAGFSYITQQTNYISDNTNLSTFIKQHTEKNKIRLVLFVFIAFLFVVCGLNSVLFFQKYEESNALEVELNLYESKNSQITQLLDNYQKKKNLIEQAGIFENKKMSVYADKIAATLPDDILLRELYFNPEDGETAEDSLTDFKENVLIIKGNCSKSLLLNDWINILKSQSFIKKIDLETFIYNSEGHLPNFVLKANTQ